MPDLVRCALFFRAIVIYQEIEHRLFALAREQVLAVEDGAVEDGAVLGILDELFAGMVEHDFLVALPALRQAFAFFPPREREAIAQHLLDRRGLGGSARGLLRTAADPVLIGASRQIEARVDALLAREGLLHPEGRDE